MMMVNIRKQYANSFKPSNKCKCFIKINTLNLCVALCYRMGIIPHHFAIFVLLVAVDPLSADDNMLAWIWTLDKLPHIVELELMQFILHGLNPFRLQKCFIYLSGLCRCQNRRITGRGSRTVCLRSMVIGDRGHNVYPGSGHLYGGNTLLPA